MVDSEYEDQADGKAKAAPDGLFHGESEAVVWKSVAVEMPDSDINVLVFVQGSDDYEFIWIGYHDGERWCSVDAAPFKETVTYWAELPIGPLPPDDLDEDY